MPTTVFLTKLKHDNPQSSQSRLFFLLLYLFWWFEEPATQGGECKTPVTVLGGTINRTGPKVGTKMYLILNGGSAPVSEIKLIRTDTTLDLSQKAEKVCLGTKVCYKTIGSAVEHYTYGSIFVHPNKYTILPFYQPKCGFSFDHSILLLVMYAKKLSDKNPESH